MGKKDLRIYALLELLRNSPILSIKELAEKFQVSEMTIRRDLDYLKKNQLLYDQQPIKTQEIDYSYSTEQIKHLDKKERISKFAVSLIEKDDILILDSGTTTGIMSKYIPEDQNLTVLCYNFNILSELHKKEDVAIIFAGGYYHKKDLMFESPESVELIKRTRGSKLFLSAFGVHSKLGITCAYPYEIMTKRAAIDSALTKILLADSSKFGQVKAGYFAKLEEIDVIITDNELSEEWQEIIKSHDIRLYLV